MLEQRIAFISCKKQGQGLATKRRARTGTGKRGAKKCQCSRVRLGDPAGLRVTIRTASLLWSKRRRYRCSVSRNRT